MIPTPLDVKFDEFSECFGEMTPTSLVINGVAISWELLTMMTQPDPDRWLRFERKGDEVTVHSTTREMG